MSFDNVVQVFESKTPKVYKSKKLNNANFGDFSHNDYRVFSYLISKIGGVDEYGKYLQPAQLGREYFLTAQEFSQLFDTDLSHCYRLIHRSCKKLLKTSIILEKPELSQTWEINVCSIAIYNKNEGSITVRFTEEIMPYLAQVRQKFILYNLKEIANFGSLYTTRLYEMLQDFKETGWVVKSIEQLKEIFAVGNKFKTYNNFKQRTFSHACEEINANYNMNLCFEEIKKGRKVLAVKFTFRKTTIYKTVNQKTGKHTNIYIKPEVKPIIKNKKNIQIKEKILTQNSNIQALPNESKSIKGILSSLFSKIKSF